MGTSILLVIETRPPSILGEHQCTILTDSELSVFKWMLIFRHVWLIWSVAATRCISASGLFDSWSASSGIWPSY